MFTTVKLPLFELPPIHAASAKFANVVTDQVMREAEVRQAAGVAYDISLQTDVSAERGASVVNLGRGPHVVDADLLAALAHLRAEPWPGEPALSRPSSSLSAEHA